MSSTTSISLSSQAQVNINRIASKSSLRKIAKRIDALATFPQPGIVDSSVPNDPSGMECRITHVTSYGIRFRYDPTTNTVFVDAITDERNGSYRRFL